jgi:hypothetical protein
VPELLLRFAQYKAIGIILVALWVCYQAIKLTKESSQTMQKNVRLLIYLAGSAIAVSALLSILEVAMTKKVVVEDHRRRTQVSMDSARALRAVREKDDSLRELNHSLRALVDANGFVRPSTLPPSVRPHLQAVETFARRPRP